MKAVIETHGLSHHYGKKAAVRELNLSVPEGSVFAFLGPNGAGKTTVIKLLLNLVEATEGRASILGVDSTRLGPAEMAQIGYVSENQQMPEWMTVQALIDFCRPMYRTWDSDFCAEMLRDFRLPADQKIRHLSRGMRMKLSLVSYSISNLPSALYLLVRETEGRLTLPDGSLVESTTGISTDPYHGISLPTDYSAISSALDGIPVYRYGLGGFGANLVEIDDKLFQKIKAKPAKLTTQFDFIAGHYQVAAEVPLSLGQTFDVAGTHVRITEIHKKPTSVRLVLLKSTVRASWALSVQPGAATYDPRLKGDLTYFLLNRRKREAVTISGEGRPWSWYSQFYLSGMLVEEQGELPFGESTGPNAPVLNELWLADATLVCLERVPTNEFSKTAQFNFVRLDTPWQGSSN
jgi:ABC-type sugar transport system ATPase subunit